jgi:hypothetical protein
VAAANGHNVGYGNYGEADEQPTAAYAAAAEPAQVSVPADEQPDYPEELLPVVTPVAEAQGEVAPEAQARGPRTPRSRLRGPARRGPKPPEGAQGGSESTE